ncbi:hypothetical protein DB30_00215 [Enhygromyxa salina]|uniref:Uncharacterized protein n=1 Tax=Enhygromyxa salina TaxID=215803 RepID=A0A0C2DAI9_9BACT|nr:hypothetical protein [Enhygromyxa salina]KIG18530.1 hypothetical protein DB30_00215 [Enhygromyxa salina]
MLEFARIPLIAALALTVPLGCGKKEAPKAEEVEVLPEASNGSPLAVELVEFIGEGEERGLKVRLYNHGDKTAAGAMLLFRYYDASDKLLLVKPGTPFEKDNDFTSVSGGKYKCEPKQNNTFELDGRMLAVPADATRVEILASRVDTIAADGKTIEDWWSQENFAEWPG